MGIHTSVKAHINVRRPTLSVETDAVHEENEATNISSVDMNPTVPAALSVLERMMSMASASPYGPSFCDGNIPCFPIFNSAAKNMASYGTTSSESSRHQVNLSSTVPTVPVHPSPQRVDDILLSLNLKSFHYNDLKTATKNFHDCVSSEGGFGCFFKGWIDEHSFTPVARGTGMTIAVRRLNQSRTLQTDIHMEWLTEVNCLGQLGHPNLLKLIGYCIENDTRLLVFEFMPRGSLENHLFRRASHSNILSWNLRMKIALGAAKGLAFLHSEARVVFRNFETSKVLVDSSYNAKLFGYGPAMEWPETFRGQICVDEPDMKEDFHHPCTAPEYVFFIGEGSITSKGDVYSFGIFLLEILSSNRAFENLMSVERGSGLLRFAFDTTTIIRKARRIVDPHMVKQCSLRAAVKALELAILCLSREPNCRPDMNHVVETLETLQSSGDHEPSEISRNDSSWNFSS